MFYIHLRNETEYKIKQLKNVCKKMVKISEYITISFKNKSTFKRNVE